MVPCVCGYEARDDVDLDEHVAYMRSIDDPEDHRERE